MHVDENGNNESSYVDSVIGNILYDPNEDYGKTESVSDSNISSQVINKRSSIRLQNDKGKNFGLAIGNSNNYYIIF